MKKSRKNRAELTAQEQYAAFAAIDAIVDKLDYNTDLGEYTDDGDIIVCLSKTTYLALKRAHEKLLQATAWANLTGELTLTAEVRP